MFAATPREKGRTGRIALSIAGHGAVILALLQSNQQIRIRAQLPGTSQGSRIELTYLPGGASAPVAVKSKAAVEKKKAAAKADPETRTARLTLPSMPTAPAPAQESPKTASAPSAGQAGSESNDALGAENIQIALTTYSPSPKPDLSRLPRGTQGEVVVDITIDPNGRVADLQILHALGYGVEGMVAETVRTWTFHPATKDGVPVASVQELHFHYGPV